MKHPNLIFAAAAILSLALGGYAGAKGQGHGDNQTSTPACGHMHAGHKHQEAHQHQGAHGEPAAADAATAFYGGTVTSGGGRLFETVVSGGELRVYVYEAERLPALAARLTGTATVRVDGQQPQTIALVPGMAAAGEPAAHYCPMHAEATRMEPGRCDLCGGMNLVPQDYLGGKLETPSGGAGPLQVAVTIDGLGKEKIAFEQQVEPVGGAPEQKHSHH
ncbi:MAG: heavy metal-binding domain-containing protein [Candidatus Krumholzibacteriia bacterium]